MRTNVTPLDPSRPLASLLDIARAEGRVGSQADLGAHRDPPVRQGVVGQALALCDRIKLSTLASYARAAGYTLWAGQTDQAKTAGAPWDVSPNDGAADLQVCRLRTALLAAGLVMTLAVEQRDKSSR
jgi:hypothetical protein